MALESAKTCFYLFFFQHFISFSEFQMQFLKVGRRTDPTSKSAQMYVHVYTLSLFRFLLRFLNFKCRLKDYSKPCSADCDRLCYMSLLAGYLFFALHRV